MSVPRIAVLGPSGIGRVHIRILRELGAEIAGVLCSSPESAARQAEELGVPGHWELDAVLDEKPDAISICTPPSRHFDEIAIAFARRLPVFCEKPLFDPRDVEDRLATLAAVPHRRLMLNASNPVLLDAVADQLRTSQSERFTFRFYTTGPYQGRDIALDLLPHGLSLLLHLFGVQEIADFAWQPETHSCPCDFRYGDRVVHFDFREDPAGPRHLSFAVDDQVFERQQKGQGASYRVFLRSPQSGERWESPDPFRVYLSRFLQGEDGFALAAANMKLMAHCIAEGG